MNILKSILLGIIQGITEFLPISSSGHLSVFRYITNINAESSGLFSAMLHIGTLVAIFIFYYREIYDLFIEFFECIKDIRYKKFTLNVKKMSDTRKMLFMFVISCVPLLFLLIPVGNGNKLLDVVSVFSEDDSILAEGICFMLTGFLILLGATLNGNYKKSESINPVSAFFIGVAQTVAACFPGISRSGSTISTGLCFGISKQYMVKYSFILCIPAVLASGLVEFKDAMEITEIVPVAPLVIGVITSAIVGIFAIRLLQVIIKKDRFKYFGYYCLALGFIVTIVSAVKM